jgi:glycosyltransferase involved in cell wall biosynthesis
MISSKKNNLNFSTYPKVTVVTVVFNGKPNIGRTIESVLAQNYPNIEFIVIDGASTDGTGEIIKEYEAKLDLFISEPDDGVYDAMNKAIGQATGEFILFMNCGDVFASSDAASSAMQFIQPGCEQILFGQWLRSEGDASMKLCSPVIEKGFFNHQAVIYSRSIHSWHGEYVNVKGLTTADYLFFVTLFNSTAVKCKLINTTIAIIDVNGLSAGPQTLSQKTSIDFLCGRVGKFRLLIVLVIHPIYRQIKLLLSKVL